jgi:DtxR family transcriptional regulator, Mn-dependent transcriptional regulator
MRRKTGKDGHGAMTQSLEDYLEGVYMLAEENGTAQVRDVAKLLSVKMPSVVKAIHELKDLELVTQEPYGPIVLTTKGAAVARRVLNRHELLRSFLMKLGVSRRIADKDACLMEHILSAETLDKIRDFTERRK